MTSSYTQLEQLLIISGRYDTEVINSAPICSHDHKDVVQQTILQIRQIFTFG
jgi:hypothetical protein